MGDWLYLIIAIAAVGLLTLAGLLTSGRRRKEVPPPSGRTDVIAPPPTEGEVATEAPPEPAVDTAEPVVEAPTVEKPEGTASRLVRLRQRLSLSQGGLGKGLLALLSRERLDEDTWEEIEDTLLTADIGVAPTQALVERLRTRLRVEGGQPSDVRTVLREELIELVGTDLDRRVQVTGAEGGDPASVAFEAVKHGVDNGVDTVLVDTAGRLQNKAGLMDELGKIKRVIEKQADVTEVLLVLDATTGQNGLIQARVFSEIVDVTGIVLTKLDGSAKGGIVVQVQRELGVPVKLVGLGEGPDDMAPFDAAAFVDALLG